MALNLDSSFKPLGFRENSQGIYCANEESDIESVLVTELGNRTFNSLRHSGTNYNPPK